jgi:hypothetical protein
MVMNLTVRASSLLYAKMHAFIITEASQVSNSDHESARSREHDSTTDVARDMNLLRQASSDLVLNYLGQPYGTDLGAVYAAALLQQGVVAA